MIDQLVLLPYEFLLEQNDGSIETIKGYVLLP